MSLFTELKRRNVFRVAIFYLVMSWLVLQVLEVMSEIIGIPEWLGPSVLLLLAIGFIPTLLFSWIYELTPEGLKRETDIIRDDSITHVTAKKLDMAVIVLLIPALAFLFYDRFGADDSMATREQIEQAIAQHQAAEESESAESDRPSVAVLPFTTRSRNEDDLFFSDGVHDDLLTQLAKISGLRVISRTSVMDYRDTTKRIPEIAGELGVQSIVEGAVQRSGDMVRITAQLIDAQTDEHLWADTFDRELTASTLFAIQTEIATQIAAALRATLTPAEQAELNRSLTEDLVALESYHRARRILSSFHDDAFERASSELGIALERDPTFAAAHALMAKAYLWKYWNLDADRRWVDEAWARIEAARAITPDLPEAGIAEGFYHYWGHLDYPTALKVLEPLQTVYPNDSDLLEVLSWVNRRYGRFKETKELMKRAIELDPRDITRYIPLAETYLWLGEYSAAEEILEQASTIDPTAGELLGVRGELALYRDGDPDSASRYWGLASAEVSYAKFSQWETLMLAGRFAEAAALAEQTPDSIVQNFTLTQAQMRGVALYMAEDPQAPEVLETARAQLDQLMQAQPEMGAHAVAQCMVLGALGRSEEALPVCRRARETVFEDAFGNPKQSFIIIAGGLAMAGQIDAAFEQLEETIESPASPPKSFVRLDPRLRNLHDDPRWPDLIERARP